MKKFEISVFAQFCHNYCFEIEANNEAAALAEVENRIKDCGYQYCPGDELITEIDDIKEINND